ncbi:glutathione S-transferase family protein [Sphingomonas sp.]|uniref:glutathione S-transferase family protein n=1 Tax=Sphingomonas sp. TaxID=28214 RepID=UPI0035BC1EE7
MDQTLAATAAAAREALKTGETQGVATREQPRFELFHAATSICSQKVRTVLAHHGLAYVEHTLDMFTGQTYLPGYVRLRMLGCERFGGALVSHHSGSTSASAGGCDGAVVPTLIDWQAGDVVVDSKRICLYLDDQVAPEDRLRPDTLATAIDAELQIVDELPNYQMLMGRTVKGSESAASSKDVGGAFSQRKVAWCDRYLQEHSDDPALVAAYTAKRAKELSAAQALFSPEAMSAAYANAEIALVALEGRLSAAGTAWLFGDRETMADLFWGIELLRMENVGAAHFWEGRLPHVARFLAAARGIPAIRTAILEWPGATF